MMKSIQHFSITFFLLKGQLYLDSSHDDRILNYKAQTSTGANF
jgi:hypothetical protein